MLTADEFDSFALKLLVAGRVKDEKVTISYQCYEFLDHLVDIVVRHVFLLRVNSIRPENPGQFSFQWIRALTRCSRNDRLELCNPFT